MEILFIELSYENQSGAEMCIPYTTKASIGVTH